MCGFNPRISAWSSADAMCPPACTKRFEQTTLSMRGLTGHFISTLWRITREPRPVRSSCRGYLKAAVSRC
jgi:hypothetical protein